MSIFKKDSFLLGGILGILIPIIIIALIFLVRFLFISDVAGGNILNDDKLLLVSVFINLLPMRYYLVSLKFDRTGRGILLVTFVLGILYFIFVHNRGLSLL
ncbi:MAG: hypothetical protein K9I94_07140 [Bacteroidales bacterium]|nr:hypothetical protein [Bacteroidales bacterium]